MSRSSKSFSMGRIVQPRPTKKFQSESPPVDRGTQKTTTSKKGERVVARKRSTPSQGKTKNESKRRDAFPNPSTVEPRIAKNLPKDPKRKRATDSKPSPFGSTSVYVGKKIMGTITRVDKTQLRRTAVSVTYKPLSHKKITLG